MFRWLRIMLWGAVALTVIVVSAANHHLVSLSLFPLPYVVDAPGFMLFVGIFALGFALGGLWMAGDYMRMKRQWKRMKNDPNQNLRHY
jgi:uncharacterized integral membrane protein